MEVMKMNERLMMSEEECRKKVKELLQIPEEDLLTKYMFQEQEIEQLNNIINECADEILKELQENYHLSYGVALAIRQKLINYRELKEKNNEN